MCKDVCCHCKPLTLEVGKIYVNGYGNRLKCVAISDGFAILQHTYINPQHNQGSLGMAASYTLNGALALSYFSKQVNIVSEYKEPSYLYYNVYNSGVGVTGSTRKDCDDISRNSINKRIGVIRINKDTGEVVNEKI